MVVTLCGVHVGYLAKCSSYIRMDSFFIGMVSLFIIDFLQVRKGCALLLHSYRGIALPQIGHCFSIEAACFVGMDCIYTMQRLE